MMKKVTVAALFLLMAFVPLAGYAAGDDKPTSLPAENDSPPSGNPSYFEGVWVGSWPGHRDASKSQDVTVVIRRGKKEGVFPVKYSWGEVTAGSGLSVTPGSVKAKGKEEGDKFVFGWENKQGREFTVTLKKHEENKVKARLEKSGPLESKERPYYEAILNRK